MGIVTLAKLSGRPIVPMAVVASRRIQFNTWDRASLGLPFSQVIVVAGDYIPVSVEADDAAMEAARLAVQAGLDDAHRRAYAMVGAIDPGAHLRSATAPLSLTAYRIVTALGAPLAGPFLSVRLKRGKEDPRRIGERRGRAGLYRPAGQLVWLHGASVGEARRFCPLSSASPGPARSRW